MPSAPRIRWEFVSVGNCTIFYPIVLNKKRVSAMAPYCLIQYWPGTSPDFHRSLVCWKRSARYPYFALCWGPPIALAISYGSSSCQPQGPALRGQSGLSRQPPFELWLGVLSLFPDLERYYKSSVPDSIAAAIWFTGTTKKSHAYVTLTDGLIILDHEDPSRASGFHSHHHIDDKSPRALP